MIWFGMSIKNKRKKEIPSFEMKEGGLYSSIYLISVRDENYVPIGELEPDEPFVVLSVLNEGFFKGTKYRILSTEGACGIIFVDPRHVKALNIKP